MVESIQQQQLQELRELRNDIRARQSRDVDVVPSNDAVIVGNQEWVDETINDINITSDLGPGETVTVAETRSTDANIGIMLKAAGVTTHPGDIDGDGNDENVVEYRFERIESQAGKYNGLSGLTTTAPFGSIGNPTPLIPGSYIGPSQAFRLRFHNRSDDFSNNVTVAKEDIGAQLHARVVR